VEVPVAFQFAARPYGPNSTPEEIQAIRDCIYVFENDIVMYREVPVLSLFQVDLFHQKLDEIAQEFSSYRLLVDLTHVHPPSAEIRTRLKKMFKAQKNLRSVAVFTGNNFMLSIAAQFVFSVLGPQAFSVHVTCEEALRKRQVA
jgi:hypothetical protein